MIEKKYKEVEKKGKPKEKLSVLLATRDDHLKEALLDILGKNDYPVVAVDSCAAALHYVLENKFDLILFDLDLKELNGLDALQLIKKLRPQKPMIVISDDSSYESGVKIAKVGVYYSMEKPIDAQATQELIKSVEKKMRKY